MPLLSLRLNFKRYKGDDGGRFAAHPLKAAATPKTGSAMPIPADYALPAQPFCPAAGGAETPETAAALCFIYRFYGQHAKYLMRQSP